MAMQFKHTYLVNGSFDQAVSALDRGLAYGDGVFRTIKMRNGLPLSWPFHYQKLVADCAAISIVCPSAELLVSDFQKLFEKELFIEGLEQVVKIIVTRGDSQRGYAPPIITVPSRVMIKSAMPEYSSSYYTQGVRLRICDLRLAHQPRLAGVKHLNRIENVLARMEWHDDGIFDGMLLDQSGNVIECTMSNIFARFGNKLITPKLTECGVSGITRQRILGLGSTLGLATEIRSIDLAAILKADEIIICNSLFGAFQVTDIGNVSWPQHGLAAKIRTIIAND